ncbi:MAG: AzlC family ABC transporter permease [Peptococcaceae bacterium]|jgi:4-azaleucine resistance transporter AzlC|nr:AzlC family ABC transporter permease [Peptococcaceae bacterium]
MGRGAEYREGLRDGIPIGLGYLSVSFAFGMMAISLAFPAWAPTLISMTNLTSAGQFAGLSLIVASGPLIEVMLTQWVINLRYALMSLSLTQKFADGIGWKDRLLMAFFVTDEIFVVASSRADLISRRYYFGLATAPYLGWAGGTLLGAIAGGLLPLSVRSALGIAIYVMFIAIIIPPARHSGAIRGVIVCAAVLSCLFHFAPGLRQVSSGFVVIVCTIVTSALAAWLRPIQTEKEEGQ